MNVILKNLCAGIILVGSLETSVTAQSSVASYTSFIDYQKSFARPSDALRRKEDTLSKQFEAKHLKWPAKYIYIRSFKYDSQMEVWVKNEIKDPFRLFKTYKVCALAGSLGPKRMRDDYQVPEGFYYINEFNPKSTYYLSLGLNYPNASDRILSDTYQPGGDIYIHGSCVTVGCIPLTDNQIDELYILAAHAKDMGQDFIPVHIFPIRYNVKRSSNFLANLTKDDTELKRFSSRLEGAFDYFEKYHQLPVVMVDQKGEYIVDEVPSRIIKDQNAPKKPAVKHRERNISNLANSVHQWPQFTGGGDAFMDYLKKLGADMSVYLPDGMKKAFVQVEFIIDADGVPVNFKVLKGGHDDYNDELIERMEKMPQWQPAMLNDKPVAKKMVQTVTLEAF
jgi:murein L,D-transpeptidase YafK